MFGAAKKRILQVDSMKLFEVLQQRRGRVLFVCLGNSSRSQMAAAFAHAYGNDVIEAASTGVPPLDPEPFDLIVNLSEYDLPLTGTMVLKLSLPEDIHGEVRDRIEAFVRFLVDHFRRRLGDFWSTANPLYSETCAVAMSSR